MNKDICVCPLWRRPEFLQMWIDQVKKANGAEKIYYLFCLDTGFDKKNLEVLKSFPFEYGTIQMPDKGYKLGKQSFNVLNGYMFAAMNTKEFVFMIEEDVFIGTDFFDVHYKMHEKENLFCSIGTKNNNTNWKTIEDKNAYYLTNKIDYQSLGVCFRKKILLDYIRPHFVESYFSDVNKYCTKMFPDSFLQGKWTEQDGLIRRILEKVKLPIAFPHVPRAYHAGFYGYNRTNKYEALSFDEKLKLLKEVCFDVDRMKRESLYDDSTPVNLNTDSGEMYKLDTYEKK